MVSLLDPLLVNIILSVSTRNYFLIRSLNHIAMFVMLMTHLLLFLSHKEAKRFVQYLDNLEIYDRGGKTIWSYFSRMFWSWEHQNLSSLTFTVLCFSWDSFAPKTKKINLITNLNHRALIICSECILETKLKIIADVFLSNGFPDRVISNTIKFSMFKFNNNKNFHVQIFKAEIAFCSDGCN